MSTHFLIRRAARVAASAAVLTPTLAYSMETAIERELLLPKARVHHDPVGKRHLLERMAIDTDSRPERVLLSMDMDTEDFVLYQVATPEGKVLRSGSWLLAPRSERTPLGRHRVAGWKAGAQRVDPAGPDEAGFRALTTPGIPRKFSFSLATNSRRSRIFAPPQTGSRSWKSKDQVW